MADALAKLKSELLRKRKQAEEFVEEKDGKKMIRRGDIIAKREQEYIERQRQKYGDQHPNSSLTSKDVSSEETRAADAADDKSLTRSEVISRLRLRSQPVLLFGESEEDSRRRLIKLELEQPELNEGWNNDYVSAMRDVDSELVKEVIEGSISDARRHDVQMSTAILAEWEAIETAARLLGQDDDVNRDCNTMLKFLKFILAKWAKSLNERDEEEKKSNVGKHMASIHKQTVTHIKSLISQLENKTINSDIRHHLTKICRLLIIDRDYIQANTAYMEMAIGNAPWPVGVTRSGLHQRPGSAKAYVSNIAHVLNDETQRKYIQAFKRLMTKCQEYFPADPSRCVDYVRSE